MKCSGLSFSWKRVLGVPKMKRDIAKNAGIGISPNSIEIKTSNVIVNAVFSKNTSD